MPREPSKRITGEALDAALELYNQGRIELRKLCRLMAEYGASADAEPSVRELAQELGLLRASAESSVHDSATKHLGRMTAPKAADAMLTHEPLLLGKDEDNEPRTVLLDSSPRPSAAAQPADGVETALAEFCRAQGIRSRLSLGRSADAPSLSDAGDRQYALGAELGAGGVGRVLLGVDRDLRRAVAIKLLRDESRQDLLQVQAFVEEAMITGSLEHPNIVPVYSLSHSEELGPYYTMKRLSGLPLSQILRRLRAQEAAALQRFTLSRLLTHFVEIVRAIAFAHGKGVVHSDLKPSNIVIGEHGEVTVVDWGLAKVMGERGRAQARALLISGTPAYMAPEQAVGTGFDIDELVDIWALGAILYEILTLHVVYEAETSEETLLKLVGDRVVPPSERSPERTIPNALERICMHALEKDRLQRYQSVLDMLEDLEAFLEGTREQRQRDEEAQGAHQEVRKKLERLRPVEQRVDALQEEIESERRSLHPHEPSTGVGARERANVNAAHSPAEERCRELDEARDDLIFAYIEVVPRLRRGLAARPQHPELRAIAAEIYWSVFRRLYPARVSAPEAVREQGQSLLALLGQLALAEIVQAGRSAPQPSQQPSQSMTDDPWLDAVLSYCQDRNGKIDGAISVMVQRIAFLKAVPLFARLRGAELLPIAEVCEECSFSAGRTIFSQGEVGHALFVVLRGRVDIVRDWKVINSVGPRECFGEIAVLDLAPRTASAVAASDVHCLMLTGEQFRRIVREDGDIGLAVIWVLTERIRQATDREAHLRSSLDPI
ncbi:MAG: protein kinase [Myxococcota bacterium]|jgi:serine/threonine protein kinase|nr:protein kinase [Myxococcota bacterium]